MKPRDFLRHPSVLPIWTSTRKYGSNRKCRVLWPISCENKSPENGSDTGGAYQHRPSRPAFHVHEDIYGTVWVHPYGGGFSRFDRENNRLQSFYNGLSDANWRFSNKIHSAFSDRQGNLWMCTHSKGLEKITFMRRRSV